MKNYDEMFDKLCDGMSGINSSGNRYGYCDENGVSVWYFESDYDRFINSDYEKTDEITFEINGETYREHWFFVNEKHESSVVGYSIVSGDNDDVKFCVVGCRTDFVCDFETMYKYLTNEHYFVD